MPITTRNEKARLVREHLGHGVGTRRVTVHMDDTVTMSGSTDDTDRSQDWRAWSGTLDELHRLAVRYTPATEDGPEFDDRDTEFGPYCY